MMNLKVRATSLSPSDWRVWLNDNDISAGLTGLTLTLGAQDITYAEIGMHVDGLDVDAETLAVLQAHVDAQERES